MRNPKMLKFVLDYLKTEKCVIMQLPYLLSRGGYRIRQVRQVTYFSFNRHKDMRLKNVSNKCPLENIDSSSLRLSVSLNTHLQKLFRP